MTVTLLTSIGTKLKLKSESYRECGASSVLEVKIQMKDRNLHISVRRSNITNKWPEKKELNGNKYQIQYLPVYEK